MKKNSVTLCVCSSTADSEGRVVNELTEKRRLTGIFIPVSSELAGKGYGFEGNARFRFFCKDKGDDICSGNVIRCGEHDYTIVYAADYGKIKVLHLNTLVGRNSAREVTQSLKY